MSVLAPKEEDIAKLLMANAHIGTKNANFQMESYIFKRRSDGTHIFNLHKTWEKITLAARMIVAIENPKDVCAISGSTFGQRAVLKFGVHVGATPIAGRYTPGTFTNQIQKVFTEPRLLIVTDPLVDHQAITESSYANIPVIAFCNSDNPLTYIDVAIPCNNKSVHSVGLIWWLLAREVLRLRGTIARDHWDVMPDLYFYRDPEEAQKEDAHVTKEFDAPAAAGWDTAAPVPAADEWTAAPAAAAFGAAPTGDEWSSAPSGNWGATE